MKEVTLVGIDPGVVDTGAVVLAFFPDTRTVIVHHRVYSDVTRMDKELFIIEAQFLDELSEFIAGNLALAPRQKQEIRIFVEGYRNRGKNMRQDQQMTSLVQTLARHLGGAKIIDNTGVKKTVKPALLALFKFRFPKTNHGDLLSAARIALMGGLRDPEINSLLADFVIDHVKGRHWKIV